MSKAELEDLFLFVVLSEGQSVDKAMKSHNFKYNFHKMCDCKLTAEVRWASGRDPSRCHWPPWFCAAWAQTWTPLRVRGTQDLEVSFWPAASSAAQCPPSAGWCPPAAWADDTDAGSHFHTFPRRLYTCNRASVTQFNWKVRTGFSLDQILECVSIGPLLRVGCPVSDSGEVTQAETVLHALFPTRLFLLSALRVHIRK